MRGILKSKSAIFGPTLNSSNGKTGQGFGAIVANDSLPVDRFSMAWRVSCGQAPEDTSYNSVMDLKSPKLLYFKGLLFLVIGLLASVLLLVDRPTCRSVILLVLAVWGFARAYYFAFYVVSKYVDPQYRFSGLIDFARYLIRSRK